MAQTPAPLAWMAEARLGRAGLEAAWPLLIELAWCSPTLLGELAGRLPEPRLHALLQRFGADPALSEDQPELGWFPAWLLIVEPSLLPLFRQAMSQGGKREERCARTVIELLIAERQGGGRMNVEHRKRLRALHAGLFKRYMSTR